MIFLFGNNPFTINRQKEKDGLTPESLISPSTSQSCATTWPHFKKALHSLRLHLVPVIVFDTCYPSINPQVSVFIEWPGKQNTLALAIWWIGTSISSWIRYGYWIGCWYSTFSSHLLTHSSVYSTPAVIVGWSKCFGHLRQKTSYVRQTTCPKYFQLYLRYEFGWNVLQKR